MTRIKLIALTCLLTRGAYALQAQGDLSKDLDPFFKNFSEGKKPGIAAGIIHNGETSYLKAFGYADLENDRLNSRETKFNIGSISRQFVTLGLMILEEQNKVSRTDAVGKYVSGLPTYQYTLTVDHLINHTSGLNDIYALRGAAGFGPNDAMTQRSALDVISSQIALNFEPGSQFSHHRSDTETVLMVAIIESASDQSLGEFMQLNVFQPLRMNNTLFADSQEILDKVSGSYQQSGEGYRRKEVHNYLKGTTNLYTTAEGFAVWYKQFSPTAKTEIADLIKKLDTPVRSSGNATFTSSWGEMTVGRSFLHAERGIPKYWQFGLIGGYGANMFRFPNQDFTSFALGNNNQYNGMYAMQIAEPFMKEFYTAPPVVDFSMIKTRRLKTAQLQQYEGHYWNNRSQLARQVVLENDSLRYKRKGADLVNTMVPLGNDRFQFIVESDDILIIQFTEKGNGTYSFEFTSGGSDPSFYETYDSKEYTSNELKAFEGIYFNAELGVNYRLEMDGRELNIKHLNHGATKLIGIKENTFSTSWPFMTSITFNQSEGDELMSFTAFGYGLQQLTFVKVK